MSEETAHMKFARFTIKCEIALDYSFYKIQFYSIKYFELECPKLRFLFCTINVLISVERKILIFNVAFTSLSKSDPHYALCVLT